MDSGFHTYSKVNKQQMKKEAKYKSIFLLANNITAFGYIKSTL